MYRNGERLVKISKKRGEESFGFSLRGGNLPSQLILLYLAWLSVLWIHFAMEICYDELFFSLYYYSHSQTIFRKYAEKPKLSCFVVLDNFLPCFYTSIILYF